MASPVLYLKTVQGALLLRLVSDFYSKKNFDLTIFRSNFHGTVSTSGRTSTLFIKMIFYRADWLHERGASIGYTLVNWNITIGLSHPIHRPHHPLKCYFFSGSDSHWFSPIVTA